MTSATIPQALSTFFRRRVSPWLEVPNPLDWLTRESQVYSCLALASAGIKSTCGHRPGFLHLFLGLNSGPLAYPSGTLLSVFLGSYCNSSNLR